MQEGLGKTPVPHGLFKQPEVRRRVPAAELPRGPEKEVGLPGVALDASKVREKTDRAGL